LRPTPEVQAVIGETAPGSNITENRTYRLPLPPHPIAAEQARLLIRLALADWNIRDIIDNALIITAELVANARAPRGALSYPRLSREELKGGSWA
jgi:hypothetical protein